MTDTLPENEIKKPNLLEFLKVLWTDWGSRVTGTLSLPFTILAFKWEDVPQKTLFAVLAITAILLTVYQVWATERKTVVKLQDDLCTAVEDKLPKLEGKIDQTIFPTLMEAPDVALVFVNVAITNLGSPSIADEWEISIQKDGVSIPVILERVGEINSSDGALVISEVDAIYNRTLPMPIPRGGRVRGWIRGQMPKGLNASTPGLEVTVSFNDCYGTQSTAKHSLTAENIIPALQYHPDGGRPER